MKVWKALGVVLAGLLLIVGSYYAYWLIRAERAESVLTELEYNTQAGGASLQPPTSLTTGYDPSVSSAIFGFTHFEGRTGQAELVYKWPKVRAGQTVKSEIACRDLLIRVLAPDTKIPRLVDRKTLWEIMGETSYDRLLLAGKCDDLGCARVVDDCQLTIKAERRVSEE